MHYTPTSSSWLNLVERFFGEITRDCIREGSFSSVAALERASDDYIASRNKDPGRSSGTRTAGTSWRKSTARDKPLGCWSCPPQPAPREPKVKGR
ncbi:MAG: hypothetical protein IJ783_06655 [Kiritimatiellae bacterium]|nr:hypothetical protein [Kiritimatiellia bacterium]